ncbi:MAG: M28 family peptidase [Planctomycetes bacterium]|nr:M28 family peptidase [Planctomycetota bacterium]
MSHSPPPPAPESASGPGPAALALSPMIRSKRGPLLLCSLLVLGACGGPSGPVSGSRAMGHVEKFVGFGPRPFGSAALARKADYIAAELAGLGLQARRHEVVDEISKQTIRNLYVQIDGPDPQNGPILVIGSHYDTKLAEGHPDSKNNFRFVGAIDGGGGPAVMLELARVLQQRQEKPKVNVWLYWIDAEESIDWEWNKERELIGSKAFCRWLAEQNILPRVKAFVCIDLIGSKNFKIDRDGASDKRLQDLFAGVAKAIGVQHLLYRFPTDEELAWYRQKGLDWGITDDHKSFADVGVPSVLLIDFSGRIPGRHQIDGCQQWWHTAEDDLPAMDPNALAITGNLLVAALPDLESFVLARR